jgi:hypothetical protein
MNAPPRLFVTAARRLTTVGVGAAACALTAGCAVNPFFDSKVDPASPLAKDVARVARLQTDWPKFSDIPAMPKDVRQPAQYGADARAVTAEGDQLVQATDAAAWSLADTEAFAAKARAEAGDEAAPTANNRTSSFATEQRKRATPPPPPRK